MQLKFIVSEQVPGLGFAYFWLLKETPSQSVHASNCISLNGTCSITS